MLVRKRDAAEFRTLQEDMEATGTKVICCGEEYVHLGECFRRQT